MLFRSGTNRKNIQQTLQDKIEGYSQDLGEAVISVSFHDLKGNIPDFDINGSKPGWSASIIKVPVMISVLDAIKRGELRMDDELTIDHKYSLEPFDHVSTMPDKSKVPVHELLYCMIVQSDNEATNMLAANVGLGTINDRMQELGTEKTMLSHLLAYDVPRIITDWNPDGSNLTTANDMTNLLSFIYQNKTTGRQYMQTLLESGDIGMLGRDLPKGTVVGHKIGEICDPSTGEDIHDVGVINQDYVLSVMCNRAGRRDIPAIDMPFQDFSSRFRRRTLNRAKSKEIAQVWSQVQEFLEEFHEHNDLPFYFSVHANPQYYEMTGAQQVIGVISKVVHDIYYNGEIS